jgi:hypothetical protein
VSKEVLELMAACNDWLLFEIHLHEPFFQVVAVGKGSQGLHVFALGDDERNAEAVLWGKGIEGGFEKRSGRTIELDSLKMVLAHKSVVVVRVVFLVPVQSRALHLFVNLIILQKNKNKMIGAV